jgi:8-oxo-dGTP diphosphatase
MIFFLAAKRWSGELEILEPDKCDELRWCRLDDLPPTLMPYVKAGLHRAVAHITFSEYGWPIQK